YDHHVRRLLPRAPARRVPPSVPTRRSSDLPKSSGRRRSTRCRKGSPWWTTMDASAGPTARSRPCSVQRLAQVAADHRRERRTERSEEHTSELQSLAYLVCRLLLEKKNIERT